MQTSQQESCLLYANKPTRKLFALCKQANNKVVCSMQTSQQESCLLYANKPTRKLFAHANKPTETAWFPEAGKIGERLARRGSPHALYSTASRSGVRPLPKALVAPIETP
jgi:hypothetical protein